MRNKSSRLIMFVLIIIVIIVCWGFSFAKIIPLRSGVVISTNDFGSVTYIKAKDDSGREFWVSTALCTIGTGGRIEVLEGAHYTKVKSEALNQVLQDFYTARLIRVKNQEIKGFGAHGLPKGCIDLQ